MHTFLITITQPGGVSVSQCIAVEKWINNLAVKCLVSRELHKSGLLHVHAILEDKNSRAHGLKRKLTRALGEIFDFSTPNSLDVRLVKPGDEERTAGYVVKDDDVYVTNGWSIKDLLAKRALSLQKTVGDKPKATFMLNEKNAEEIILEYAKRMSMPLLCKGDFLDVMQSMATEGYSVSRIKPTIVYAQVMARAGSPGHMRDWWEMKLGAQM